MQERTDQHGQQIAELNQQLMEREQLLSQREQPPISQHSQPRPSAALIHTDSGLRLTGEDIEFEAEEPPPGYTAE